MLLLPNLRALGQQRLRRIEHRNPALHRLSFWVVQFAFQILPGVSLMRRFLDRKVGGFSFLNV